MSKLQNASVKPIECVFFIGDPHSMAPQAPSHEYGLFLNVLEVNPCHHPHHHVVPLARISLTLSHHFSLSFITSGRSSHSCCMYVRVPPGCPAFAQPYVGVHGSTSLMSSSPLLQQCPAHLVRLTWIIFMI